MAGAGPLSNLFVAFIFGQAVQFAPFTVITPFFMMIVLANVALAVFTLVPSPPLDGSKLLYALLPDSQWRVKQVLEQYGLILLVVFILFFAPAISPIINAVFSLFTGYPLP